MSCVITADSWQRYLIVLELNYVSEYSILLGIYPSRDTCTSMDKFLNKVISVLLRL